MTTSEILDRAEGALTPQMAIIVNSMGYSEYYLERRDIVDGKMTAAVPLTRECLTDIVNTLSSDEKDIIHGSIPANMIYADSRRGFEKYIWFNPPERRKLYFHSSLNIPNGEMLVPGLLYVVIEGTLSIYAFKGRKPKNKLFRAPFFNTYTNGSVCLGNAKAKKASELTYASIIQYWEDMFWKSEFVSTLFNPIEGNLSTLTRQLIKSGEKFPESKLLPVETTLKRLLQ